MIPGFTDDSLDHRRHIFSRCKGFTQLAVKVNGRCPVQGDLPHGVGRTQEETEKQTPGSLLTREERTRGQQVIDGDYGGVF